MNSRLVLFVMAVVFAARSYGVSVSYGPKYLNPTEEVVTPHIAWAKPGVQRPLKVLFVANRGSMREAVEISQRMDLEYTFFCPQQQESEYTPIEGAPKSIMDEGLRKLAGDYDVIVLGNIDWGRIPLVFQYKILQKVKAGTGLVGLVTGSDEYLKRATAKKRAIEGSFLVPYKGLPAFAEYKNYDQFLSSTLETSEFGKGSIYLFKGYKSTLNQCLTPGMPDTPDPRLVEYDYYLGYVIHILNLAAGRHAAVRIQGSSDARVEREGTPVVEFSMETDEPRDVVCRLVLRDMDNEEIKVAENKLTLTAGKTIVSLPLKGVPAGGYFADLWVMQNGRVVAFGSKYVLVQSKEKIEKIDIKKTWLCKEGVQGTITVKLDSGPVALRIWQEDTLGRITAKTEMKADGGSSREVAFALPATQPLTIVQYLKAALCRGQEIIDFKKAMLSFEDLYPKDDLRYIAWCSAISVDYLAYRYCEEMRKAGFDTLYSNSYSDGMMRWANMFSNPYLVEMLGRYNLRIIAYATRIFDTKTDHYTPLTRCKDDHVRTPCLNDPAYRKLVESSLARQAVRLKPYSTFEFSMGDECHFASIIYKQYELCFCSNCVSGFHGFLRREYKDIAGLNREYESSYRDFDEVWPVTLAEARKDAKLRPLWVDYRRYMEDTWVDIYRFGRDVIQKNIPGARVGYDGSDWEIGNSFKAVNFRKLMRTLRLNNAYEGYYQPYCFKDFCQPGTLLGLGWDGGYNIGFRSVESQRYLPWKHIFQGADSLWEWNGEPACLKEGITAPDYSFYDFFKANLTEVRELKAGVGKLMMNIVREHDGIAILYPGSSVHASTLAEGFPFIEKELNAWVAMLLKTHRQFKFISYADLAAGILKKEKFTTLILPFSQAMSKEEVTEVIGFVKTGGVVIADLRPGVCDEHGKAYGVSPLDEVFGVRQSPQEEQPVKGSVRIDADGFPTNMPETVADRTLTVVSGKACAEVKQTPALIVNQYDRGRAILLNFGMGDYLVKTLEKSSIMEETTPLLKPFGEALFKLAGHTPLISINPDVEDLLVYGFKSGELSYYGLLEELPEPLLNYQNRTAKPLKAWNVTVKLDGPGYVYDVRRGKYVGYVSEFETSVKPGIARLYSRLPYYVRTLDARTPWMVSQGDTLKYELILKAKGRARLGRHIFHIKLIGPDGVERSHYADNILADGGNISGEITLAWNESPGIWTLKVRDIATGLSDQSWFLVRKARK